MPSYNRAQDAYEKAKTAKENAEFELLYAAYEASQAEIELLRSKKAASDALVAELLAV